MDAVLGIRCVQFGLIGIDQAANDGALAAAAIRPDV
jgi:hypothetical protein